MHAWDQLMELIQIASLDPYTGVAVWSAIETFRTADAHRVHSTF